eukprot:275780_1
MLITLTTTLNHTKQPLQTEKSHIIITLLFIALTILMNNIIKINEHLIQSIDSYDLSDRHIIFSPNKRKRIEDVYGLNSSILSEVADPTKKHESLHQITVILRSSNPYMRTLDGFTSTLRSILTRSTYKTICKYLCTKWGKLEKQDQVQFARIRFRAPPHKSVDFNNIINIFKLNVLSDNQLLQI